MLNLERIQLYKKILEKSNYFKLVCGAGNENQEEVEYLSFIYTLAGCSGFDISASPQIVQAAKKGILFAYEKAEEYGIKLKDKPFITISVGMPGDHHVRKAIINTNCVECRQCIPACPTDAIPDNLQITRELCIGCGNCEVACPPSIKAVEYIHDSKSLMEVIPKCLDAGAESVELHASISDHESTLKEWNIVCSSTSNYMVSLCLDRRHLSNASLIERIKSAYEIAGDRLILQADGTPISGGDNNFNTTLQSISIADVINKELKNKHRQFKNLPVVLSGGTNALTGQLARSCGVKFNGIAIGTYARNLVKEYRSNIKTMQKKHIKEAVLLANRLINNNLIG